MHPVPAAGPELLGHPIPELQSPASGSSPLRWQPQRDRLRSLTAVSAVILEASGPWVRQGHRQGQTLRFAEHFPAASMLASEAALPIPVQEVQEQADAAVDPEDR